MIDTVRRAAEPELPDDPSVRLLEGWMLAGTRRVPRAEPRVRTCSGCGGRRRGGAPARRRDGGTARRRTAGPRRDGGTAGPRRDGGGTAGRRMRHRLGHKRPLYILVGAVNVDSNTHTGRFADGGGGRSSSVLL